MRVPSGKANEDETASSVMTASILMGSLLGLNVSAILRGTPRRHQGEGGSVRVIRLVESRFDVAKAEVLARRENRVPRQPVAVRRAAARKARPEQRGAIAMAIQRVREVAVRGRDRSVEARREFGSSTNAGVVVI